MIRATFPALVFTGALLAPVLAHGQDSVTTKASSEDKVYEGWRQYSVHCARCHGQDVLGNPVAADLLVAVAPGGTSADHQAFVQVVTDGRLNKGMPAFAQTVTPEKIDAIYSYVRGRAEKKIPAGRPDDPKATGASRSDAG
jgi:mono/diheme cytochrome c family protein